MWGYVFFWPRFKDYWSGFRDAIISKIDLTKILKVGVGAGAQFLFEVGAFGFAAIMIGWMGTNQLAAHQIAINLASISYMMASGLSAAATIRAGNQLGRKDIPALRSAIHSIFIMVIIFMSASALIFIFGKDFLPSLYINDQSVTSVDSSDSSSSDDERNLAEPSQPEQSFNAGDLSP